MTGRRDFSERNQLIKKHSCRIQNAKTDMGLAGIRQLWKLVCVDGRDDCSASFREVFAPRSAVGLVVNDATDSRLRVRHEFP